MKRFKLDKILYIIVGVILLVGGILLLPALTPWFDQVVGIITGSLLIIFTVVTLFFVKSYTKYGRVVSIVETLIYLTLGGLSIASDIHQFEWLSVCHLIAIFLWVRGVANVIRNIYFPNTEQRFGVKEGIFSILFISIGAYIFAKPISDMLVEYIVSVSLMLLGVIGFVVSSILFKIDHKKVIPASGNPDDLQKLEEQKEESSEEESPKEEVLEGEELQEEEKVEDEVKQEKEASIKEEKDESKDETSKEEILK